MPVVEVVRDVIAKKREDAEKKILRQAKKNLHVICNPTFVKKKRVPGLWRCEIGYVRK